MSKYITTIGLEIHAELKTQTKMFCDSLNDPNEKHPNVNICPVCTGQPGALPTINKKAVEAVLKVGMALNGDIPQTSKFDRKNYFYPDLPKGYQISQYDLPLVFGGMLNGVRLRRIHLEEDTGRLQHAEDGKNSFVDFNRASVPLMELVTEPDIKNSEQAVEFARELQLILRYLGVSDADMEKGQMRVEANISISKDGEMGTKVEVKNINSFKAAHDAIEYELKRQEEVLESGGKITQETRGWDEAHQKTVSQRTKEEAHDYRYFPEPDLPPMDIGKFDLRRLKEEIPELPREKRLRFAKEYSLTPEQAEILVTDREAAKFFEESASEYAADEGAPNYQLLFNYFTTDLRGVMVKAGLTFADLKITQENFADLVVMADKKEISSRTAKDILAKMVETGLDPRAIVKTEGLTQVSDEGRLKEIAQRIIVENPKPVEDYKKGKTPALQALVGKAMGQLRGSGNPEVLQKIFKELLS